MVVDNLNGPPSGGAATGLGGTIYFGGFVEEKDPELVSTRRANIPGRLRLLVYRPK